MTIKRVSMPIQEKAKHYAAVLNSSSLDNKKTQLNIVEEAVILAKRALKLEAENDYHAREKEKAACVDMLLGVCFSVLAEGQLSNFARTAIPMHLQTIGEIEKRRQALNEINKQIKEANAEAEAAQSALQNASTQARKKNASHAAHARHEKPDSQHMKAKAIVAIWASGKYSTRSECAV
jgi:hypothetical protein